MNNQTFDISIVDWNAAKPLVQPIRQTVFVEEQKVPEELEWDEYDKAAKHAVARSDQQLTIGCGRLLSTGHIGRMAVLNAYRGQGIGSAILISLEEEAKRLSYPKIILHAQLQALPFYIQHGYHTDGEIFEEAGIPHQICIKYL